MSEKQLPLPEDATVQLGQIPLTFEQSEGRLGTFAPLTHCPASSRYQDKRIRA